MNEDHLPRGKTKTVTITYPDNFDEWDIQLNGMDEEIILVCPLQRGCQEIFGGGSMPYLRSKIELHNRAKHATETTSGGTV